MFNSLLVATVIFGYLLSAGITAYAEDQPPQTDEDKKVFRKFHPDGVVEFSDQPIKGSEELKMETLPTYKFTTPKLEAQTKHQIKPVVAPSSPYTALAINSPARNEAIRANNGDVHVSYTLTPDLQAGRGHQVEYLLDGKSALKADGPATLQNTDRGSHSLVVRIIDKNNKVLISSDPVTFYLLRQIKPRAKP